MKVYSICILISINLGCKQSLQDSMLNKIETFERNETKYFTNITLHALRNSKKQKPLEFQMFRKDINGYAVFQVTPDRKIFRNFPHDSIQLDMVSVVDSLKIRGLYNYDEKTQLEFYYQDDYVILYRKNLFNRKAECERSKPQEVIGDWQYFKFKIITN